MTPAPTPRELEEMVAAGMRMRLSVNVLRHAPQVGHGWLNELSVALAADALAVVREALAEPTPEMLNEGADLTQDDEDNDPLGSDEVRSEFRSIWRAMLAASPLRAAP